MLRLFKSLISLLAVCTILLALVFAFNYFNTKITVKQTRASDLKPASDTISILNWNIGYAGLGKDSDFYMDGGQMLAPPNVDAVKINTAGIQEILRNNAADIYLFQEISEPDRLTLGIDVLAGITRVLSGYHSYYSSDFRTKFIPTKWALRHGLATYSRISSDPVELIELPLEPTKLAGIIQRLYHIEKTSFKNAGGEDWVILNIHLSAFDEGGNIRLKQLDRLVEIANDFYKQGNHVVVGGDWNIQLADTEFPTTTKEEFLFWRTKLPSERILPGWEIVVDETTPTMRSNERPYVRGENFTSIIDGYMISPNVETLSVETIDTNFEFTDHQPVKAVFKSRK